MWGGQAEGEGGDKMGRATPHYMHTLDLTHSHKYTNVDSHKLGISR